MIHFIWTRETVPEEEKEYSLSQDGGVRGTGGGPKRLDRTVWPVWPHHYHVSKWPAGCFLVVSAAAPGCSLDAAVAGWTVARSGRLAAV